VGVDGKKWGLIDVWIVFCYRFENRYGYRGGDRCKINFIISVDEEHLHLHLQVEHHPRKTEYEVAVAL
jgi:hypothetical protein